MTFRLFEQIFDEILYETPLPHEHYWKLQRLTNRSLNNDRNWLEVLYRTRAKSVFKI